jgi:hypothetical protein
MKYFIHFLMVKVSRSYFQYQLNFESIRRSDFDFLCHRLRPNEVLSLALCDNVNTPDQSKLFFSRFRIEQFRQLKSLTLIQIEIDSLELIFNDFHQLHQLCSLSINIESISHIQNQLINSQLIHLKLGKCSIDELETILQYLVKLKSLDVCLNMKRSKFKLNLPHKQLIRLNIKVWSKVMKEFHFYSILFI